MPAGFTLRPLVEGSRSKHTQHIVSSILKGQPNRLPFFFSPRNASSSKKGRPSGPPFFISHARKEGDVLISTNTIEGYFSILKRGINGVYHHVGKQHLHRYLSEFDFRYNSREVKDGERSLLAIQKVTGKRLKYRDSSGV
jgi:hypothetical protein